MKERRLSEDSTPAPRYPVAVPVLFRGDDFHGTGLVENISISGALISEATPCPVVQAKLHVRLLALGTSLRSGGPDSLELQGEVVRLTDTGFGVRFVGESAALTQLLNRAMSGTHKL